MGSIPLKYMLLRLKLHMKQFSPTEVTDEGIMIDVKLLQKKQWSPNEVTDEGISMEVKPLQFSKQLSSKAITEYSTPLLSLTFYGRIISPE